MRGIGLIILSFATLIWFLITFKYFSSGVAIYSDFGSKIHFASALLLIGLFVFGYLFGKALCYCRVKQGYFGYIGDRDDAQSFDFSKVGDNDMTSRDNLKVIEGVGPKLEELLNTNGITTFEELSNKNVSDLEQIIESAGNKFAMHKPKTWPEQAKLAHKGKWDELKEYQNFLYRGLDS